MVCDQANDKCRPPGRTSGVNGAQLTRRVGCMETTPLSSSIEKLWTIGEVASYLGCTVRHVHNLLRAGLPHLYLGRLLRFDPQEVRSYLLKQRRVA